MFGPFYFPFSCNKDYAMQVEITAKKWTYGRPSFP